MKTISSFRLQYFYFSCPRQVFEEWVKMSFHKSLASFPVSSQTRAITRSVQFQSNLAFLINLISIPLILVQSQAHLILQSLTSLPLQFTLPGKRLRYFPQSLHLVNIHNVFWSNSNVVDLARSFFFVHKFQIWSFYLNVGSVWLSKS